MVQDYEVPVRSMLAAIDDWYRQNVRPAEPPEGMRVELHPSVFNAIRQLTDTGYSTDPDDWKKRFKLPVKITTDLPKNTWRLVTVTEEVHTGGELP